MEIKTRKEGSYSVIAPSGEIDFHYSPKLREEILARLDQGQHVVLDMGAVSYISSSCIATMVEGLQQANEKSLSFGLANLTAAVTEVLKLARLDTIFSIHETVEAATRSGPGSPR